MPPQDQVIEIPGVGNIAFPSSMSPDEVSAAAKRLYDGANPPEKSFLQKATDTAVGVAKGVGKSAAGLALGGAELVSPALRKIPIVKDYVATPEQLEEARRVFATPEGTAEKVGAFAGEAAQFAIPATKVTKLGTGAKVVQKLLQAGVSPNRARIVAGLAEGALQGGTAAGVATARGDEGVGTTAALNAVMPVAARAVEIGAPAIRARAEQQVAKLLSSGLQENNQSALVQEALKSGQTAATAVRSSVGKAVDIVRNAAGELLSLPVNASWGKWQTMLASRTESAKQFLGAALKGPLGDTMVPTAPLVKSVDDLIDSSARHLAQVKGGYRQVPFDEPLMKELNALKDQLATYDGQISVRNLVDIKRVWDKTVYTLATAGKVNADPNTLVSSAMKEAAFTGANAIRQLLDSNAPTIAKLDGVVSHAIRLEDLVKKVHTANPAMGAGLRNAATAVGAAAGAVAGGSAVGGYTGHILGAHLGGAATRMLTKALESPMWHMASPAIKARLADAIQAGRGQDVIRLVAPIVSATAAGPPVPSHEPTAAAR